MMEYLNFLANFTLIHEFFIFSTWFTAVLTYHPMWVLSFLPPEEFQVAEAQVVKLGSNKISDEGLQHLYNLKNLTSLHLPYGSTRTLDLVRLKEELPTCSISEGLELKRVPRRPPYSSQPPQPKKLLTDDEKRRLAWWRKKQAERMGRPEAEVTPTPPQGPSPEPDLVSPAD